MLEDKGEPYYCPLCRQKIRSIEPTVVTQYFRSTEYYHHCPESPMGDGKVMLVKKKDLEEFSKFVRLCLGRL